MVLFIFMIRLSRRETLKEMELIFGQVVRLCSNILKRILGIFQNMLIQKMILKNLIISSWAVTRMGEATGRKVDVDGNLQLLCAIVMGKLMKPMLQLELVHQLLNMVKIIILIFGIKSL